MAILGLGKKRQRVQALESVPKVVRYPLDMPLLRFSDGMAGSNWTLRHACENTQIFGRIGSGKTSGSGMQLAQAFVGSGFGGLVLSAKPSDLKMWRELCAAAGRDDDLVVFDASGSCRFNFMDYELKRQGEGVAEISNITSLLTQLSELKQGRQGGENEAFWRSNLERLINNALQVAVAADGTASLARVEELITSAPKSLEQRNDPEWQAGSALALALQGIPDPTEDDADGFGADLQRAFDYWAVEYPMLDERTRSNILASFQGIADKFLRGKTRKLFCSDITVLPEFTHVGKIIFMDLALAEHGPFGRMAQVLFKYVWEQATLRRQAGVDSSTRPVFLWIDESQEFITSSDADFLNRCRDARAGAVFLTQSLPNYHNKLGREATQSLLGSLNTKVFHSLACSETAQYACELIGRTLQTRGSYSTPAEQPKEGYAKPQASFSETMEYQVHPREFFDLRSGGDPNGNIVDAILVQGGRTWPPSGANYLHWSMLQR